MILSRLLSSALLRRQLPALKIILGVKLALLVANAALTIDFGPFSNGDDVPAVLTGMVLIAAMAIENAAHRIHLGSGPPSTLMTGCVYRKLKPGRNDGEAPNRFGTWPALDH